MVFYGGCNFKDTSTVDVVGVNFIAPKYFVQKNGVPKQQVIWLKGIWASIASAKQNFVEIISAEDMPKKQKCVLSLSTSENPNLFEFTVKAIKLILLCLQSKPKFLGICN